MKRTCVLGGGICGLISAWKREREGEIVTVLESSKRVGGVIQSEKIDDFLMDYGPNTLSLRLNKTKNLLEETGVLEHAIDANTDANKRFIVRNGKLVTLPSGLASFASSGFLSLGGKARLLLEPFLPKGKDSDNESVAGFMARRLGKEALDYLANPLLAGIYAAKPETLCMRHTFPAIHDIERKHRSLLLGKLFGYGKSEKLPQSRLISFSSGMGELTERIKDTIKGNFVFDHTITRVSGENGKWRVFASDSSKTEWSDVFDRVVCTLPAHRLGNINWENVTHAEKILTLQESSHFPLSLVFLGFDQNDVRHPLDGFGFLVPEVERMDILGTLFSSTLFPGRAPSGKVLLTTFVGGERNPELALAEDSVLCRKVTDCLSSLLGIGRQPEFEHVKTWKEAIPLPDLNYDKRKKAAETLRRKNPGLSFTGSHVTGPPLPNCLDVD